MRRRDEKLNVDSEATSPRVSRSMKDASSSNVCTDFVELFSMKVNLKVFCTLCLCIIIVCDTNKASKNLSFILKQSLILSSVFVVIIICCLGAMKIKDSIEQMTLDLFQNYDVPEEVSVTLDPEVVLNDEGFGKSCYERFYCVRNNYARENRRLPRRSREPSRVPLKEFDVCLRRAGS